MIEATDTELLCGCDWEEDDESEPWLVLFYEDRDDAFEAVDAADLLGLNWRLASRRSDTDVADLQHWVVELWPDANLPMAATGLLARCVD